MFCGAVYSLVKAVGYGISQRGAPPDTYFWVAWLVENFRCRSDMQVQILRCLYILGNGGGNE